MAPKKAKAPEEFIVEKLVDMKVEKGKELFLVKWKGYPKSDNTWEPPRNLAAVKDEMEAMRKPAKKAPAKRKEPEAAAKPAPKKQKVEEKKPAPKAKAAPKKAPKIDVLALARGLMATITGKKVEEEKPTKAAKKPKKAKDEVVEVDKIKGMKLKKGGILYLIGWEDGTESWEPEDNVMDDDLVDEYEEKEQADAYAKQSIGVGAEVEVKANVDGFENSWSAAVVKKKAGGKYVVEFAGFVDDDGKAMGETVERARLRLVPEPPAKDWAPLAGEIIEVNEDDCWWEARVLSISGKKAELKYRVSDEVKSVTLGKKVRPCGWLKFSS